MRAQALKFGLVLVMLSPVASAAQSITTTGDLAGTYHTAGMSCLKEKAGEAGGPVLIDPAGMKLAGLQCSFGGVSSLSRMSAVLIDASCTIAGVPRATRLFINRSPEGVTCVSRAFGTFVLETCM